MLPKTVFLLLVAFAICNIANTSFAKDQLLRGLNSEEEEAVRNAYAQTRALLGHDEINFLEQILVADELIMERKSRGIVDQILAAISGMQGSGLNSIMGTIVSNPSNVVSTNQQPQGQQPVGVAQVPNNNANAGNSSTQQMNNDNHLFSQVSKVVSNSVRRNVTGIVDEALKIGTPAPVRDLVNGILGVVYCNGIRRLLGRC